MRLVRLGSDAPSIFAVPAKAKWDSNNYVYVATQTV